MEVFIITLLLFTAIANGQLKTDERLYDLIHYFVEFADVHRYFQVPSIALDICSDTTELIATLQTIVEKNNTDINTKTLGNVFHGAVERLMEDLKKYGADFGNRKAFVGRFQFSNDELGLALMPERAKIIFKRFLELRKTLRQLPHDSDEKINKTMMNKIRGQCAKLGVANGKVFDFDFNAKVTPFLHKLSNEHYQTPERPYWATFVLYLSLIRCMMTDLLESGINICNEFTTKNSESQSRVKRDSGETNGGWAPKMTMEDSRGTTECSSRWGKAFVEKTGGVLQKAAKSEIQCKETCEEEPMCIALDFDSSKQECYLHVDVNMLKKSSLNQDYTQYVVEHRLSDYCTRSYVVLHKSIPTKKGILKDTISTLLQCEELCDHDTEGCFAFYFHRTERKCYVITKFVLTSEHESDENYDSYFVETACKICEQLYKLISGQSYYSSNYKVQSLRSCKEKCIKDSKCASIDYNFKNNTCFMHHKTPRRSVEDKFSIHYEIPSPKLQSCNNYNRLLKGVASPNGKAEKNPDGLDACLKLCRETEGCVGMNFKSETKACYLHSDQKDFENYQSFGNGIMQIEMKTTCEECKTTFITKEGHASPNGVLKEIDKPSKCKELCVTDTKCLAVDLNKRTNECRIHYSEANLKKTLGESDAHLFRFYLIYRCPGWR